MTNNIESIDKIINSMEYVLESDERTMSNPYTEYGWIFNKINEWKKALERLERELESQWIPVSERLPETGTRVLVTYSDGEVGVINQPRPKLWIRKEHTNLITPIAWIPLPEPYKEGE